jgi:hypothetical protein
MLYCETGEIPTSLLGRYWTVWYRRAMLRMEDRIRRLCSELLAKKGDEEVGPIVVELRNALHVHIERMRERFGAYPFLIERRVRNDIPPVNKQDRTARRRKPA